MTQKIIIGISLLLLRVGTVFAQYQDKNCITSQDLFKTTSVITTV